MRHAALVRATAVLGVCTALLMAIAVGVAHYRTGDRRRDQQSAAGVRPQQDAAQIHDRPKKDPDPTARGGWSNQTGQAPGAAAASPMEEIEVPGPGPQMYFPEEEDKSAGEPEEAQAAGGPGRIETERRGYPRRIRREVPGRASAAEFARSGITDMTALWHPTPDSKDAATKAADLLAETMAGVAEVRAEVIELARHGGPDEKRCALLLLGRISSADALDFLLHEALTSPDPTTRSYAASALGQDQGWNVEGGYATTNPGPIANPEIVSALLAAAHKETDAATFHIMAHVLQYQLRDGILAGPDADADRMAHPDGMHFAEQTLSVLREVIEDARRPQDMRMSALSALSGYDSAAVTEVLTRAVRSGPTEKDRQWAALSLSTLSGIAPERLPVLMEALHDPSLQVRQAAAQSSSMAGRDEEFARRLIDLYHTDPSPQVSQEGFRCATINLIARRDRFGRAAVPDYGRAVDLMDEALHSGGNLPQLACYARETLHQIMDAVAHGDANLTAEQKARLTDLPALVDKCDVVGR